MDSLTGVAGSESSVVDVPGLPHADNSCALVLRSGLRVTLRRLKGRPELNHLDGCIVKELHSGRLGVKLDRGGDVLAVRPENLEVAMVAQGRERLRMYRHVVHQMFQGDVGELKRIIWSLLWDPANIVIMNGSATHVSSKGLVQNDWNRYMSQHIVYHVNVQVISLQTARARSLIETDLSDSDYHLFVALLCGPGLIPSASRTGRISWHVKGHSAMPESYSPGNTGNATTVEEANWFRISSDGPTDNSTITFQTASEPAAKNWSIVASLEGGWIARVWRKGLCQAYDITTGALLGSCKSIKVNDCERGMCTCKDYLLVWDENRIETIQVARRVPRGRVEVCKVSNTLIECSIVPHVVVHGTQCAVLHGDLDVLRLYNLTCHGLVAKTHSIIHPYKLQEISSVSMTGDSIITIEVNMNRAWICASEVVVRCAMRPHSPPTFIIGQNFQGHNIAAIFSYRPNLQDEVTSFVRFRQSLHKDEDEVLGGRQAEEGHLGADHVVQEITDPTDIAVPTVIPPTLAADIVHAQWVSAIEHGPAQMVTIESDIEHVNTSTRRVTESSSSVEPFFCAVQPERSQERPDALSSVEDNELAQSRVAQSAPPSFSVSGCLLPDTCVLTRQGPVNVGQLGPGQEVFSGTPGMAVTVRTIRLLPARDRDIIVIRFNGLAGTPAELTMTASHMLAVRRKDFFKPALAAEIVVGDRLRTFDTTVIVTLVSCRTSTTEVIELELEDVRASVFVAHGPTAYAQVFVEVYGSLARMHNDDEVIVLSFKRFDRFRQALLESEELRACRDALEQEGFDVDLGVYGFGPGKLLVRADMAWRTLNALRRRGQYLKSSDVVVSQEFRLLILEEVRRHSPRAFLLNEEVVDLSRTSLPLLPLDRQVTGAQLCRPTLRVEGTFIHYKAPRARSAVTHSTTDVRLGIHMNPRTRI